MIYYRKRIDRIIQKDVLVATKNKRILGAAVESCKYAAIKRETINSLSPPNDGVFSQIPANL